MFVYINTSYFGALRARFIFCYFITGHNSGAFSSLFSLNAFGLLYLYALRASSAPFRPRFPTEGRNTKVVVLVLRILYNGTLHDILHPFSAFLHLLVPFVSLGIAEKEETLETTLSIIIYFVFFVRDKLDWLIYWFASFRWFWRE